MLLLIFLIFNLAIVSLFKTRGIDQFIKNSISSYFNNIDNLAETSVKQHLELENKILIYLTRHYYDLSKNGYITENEAKVKVLETISEHKLGMSGYSYVVDYDGTIIAHPVKKHVGKNYINDKGIKWQTEQKEGYSEYKWKNPDDEINRDKMLYMRSFEPWKWIISTTAYSDDKLINKIRIDDIKNYIINKKISGIDSISLHDGKGNILLDQKHNKDLFYSTDSFIKSRLEEIRKTKSGRFKLHTSRNLRRPDLIVFYSYYEDLDWIITAAGDSGNLYSPVNTSYFILLFSLLLAVSVFIILNEHISNKITSPLNNLVAILDLCSEGNTTIRADIKTDDELGILGMHFNNFMDKQKEHIEKIDKAQNSIKILAKFPDETPNPVIRLSNKGILEYANKNAMDYICSPLNLKIGDLIQESLLKKFLRTDTLTGRNEYSINEKIYSFTVSYIHEPEATFIYGKDITKQKKFESIQLLSDNIFNNSIEGIVITDSKGIIESVNPSFTVITGFTSNEVIGKNPRILKSHKHGSDFYKAMWDSLLKKGFWSGEIWNRRKNGQVYAEYLTISAIRDNNGDLIQYVSFFHDLSEIKEKEEKIHYEATHDQLTGLPNRDYLNKYISPLIKQAEKNSSHFSVIYLDINNFKRINESLGPEAGDILLIEAGRRLTEFLKFPNIAVRVGSDEFVCLCQIKDGDNISSVVDDILRIFKPAFVIKGNEVDIGISAGISVYPDDDKKEMELVAKAETAMRTAKNDVNSSYSFYTPSYSKKGLSRLEIERGLKASFENSKFHLAYQPKVSANNGVITGAEALVRVEPINGQYIGPDIFIPIAEEIGLIEPLGAWVFEKACIDIKKLIDQGFSDLQVAVNLSPWQFRRSDLPEQINNIIESVAIPPRNINVEITESMAIDDVEESIRMMKKLTDIGLTLSIDDFGTGYSSLSYLSQFPVDILKIDKAFVEGIPGDIKKTGVVLAILSLAENLGMKTVAEGVETEEHYNYLKERGCSQIQGYYFYKPMSIKDFTTVLEREQKRSGI